MTQIDLTGLVPCSHEEADTCLFLHVADAVKNGYRKFTRSDSGRLAKVNMLFRLMISGTDESSSLSRVYAV